jgi:plasmid stabilization system protein ParE
MKVVISGRAARQIHAIEQWWQANRMDARNAFTQELANAFRQLAEHPQSGARVRGPRANEARLRQLTLPVTRYLVFYRVHRREVQIATVWHASRDRRRS